MSDVVKKTVDQSVEIIAKAVEVLPAYNDRIAQLEAELIKMKAMPVNNETDSKKKNLEARVSIIKAMAKGKQEEVAKAVEPTVSGEYAVRMKAAVNETVGGAGGMGGFIPEEWNDNIVSAIYSYGNIAAAATKIPMSRLIMNDYEYLDSASAQFITTAGTAITTSAPSANAHTLTAKEISVLLYYDASFLADATPATIKRIEEDAGRALAYRLDYALVTGSGSADATNGGITGILNVAGTNVITPATGVGSTFTGALTVANINLLIEAIPTSLSYGKMAFVCHRTMRAVLRNLTGGSGGGYIWSPGDTANGGVDQIYGYDVLYVENDVAPTLSGTATSTKFFAFGDLSCIRIGDRQAISVAVSDQFLFSTNQVAIRWIMRADAWVLGKRWAVLRTAAS